MFPNKLESYKKNCFCNLFFSPYHLLNKYVKTFIHSTDYI